MSWFNSFRYKHSALGELGAKLLMVSQECAEAYNDTIYSNFGKDSTEARMSLIQVNYELYFI
jgi:hypothetical protein